MTKNKIIVKIICSAFNKKHEIVRKKLTSRLEWQCKDGRDGRLEPKNVIKKCAKMMANSKTG